MKSKLLYQLTACSLAAGLMLYAGRANASTVVTFSVDMTYQVQQGTFVLGTDTVQAQGTFSGWGNQPLMLTNNPTAANPNLYSGTTNDTVDGNPSLLQYKFVMQPANTYESTGDNGNNRLAALPATSGSSLVLPTVYFADEGVALGDGVTNLVTFQVDMAQQIAKGTFDPDTTNANSTVEVQGLFNGWSNTEGILSNNPAILRTNAFGLVTSNVYVGTFPTILFSPNQNADYKFVIGTSVYESTAGGLAENPDNNNNRFFTVSSQNGASITNPIVFFSDAPYAPINTNVITFQVDMTTEILRGRFNPANDSVYLFGSFVGWAPYNGNNAVVCTNNPAAANTNIYSGVFTIVDGIGATDQQYKFYNNDYLEPNGGYEVPTSTGGNNRIYKQVSGSTVVLPPVYFSDIAPMDYLPETNLVTFTVDMTGAVESGTGTPFDPSVDSVYINGDFIYLSGADWDNGQWDTIDLAAYQLTNNPVGSMLYSLTIPLPMGNNVQVNYNYGIYDGSNGSDFANEGPGNHTRWIRNTKTAYTLPTDTFGHNVAEPYAFNMVPSVSPVWAAPSGTVAIGWLGLPNVHLQASTNVLGPTWIDLPATDGANWTAGYLSGSGFVSVTNWPASNPQHYFRLIQPYIAP